MPRKLLAVALAATFSLPAFAVQRTFISTAGSDANPCSTTLPCRSIAVALAATDPGGEIIVLGSGGYGSATINKSVTIQSPSGTYAGISVFPGNDGITVNGANISVVLRGLSINGQGGTPGIWMLNGAELHVEGCVVSGLVNGIVIEAGSTSVKDTIVRDNSQSGVKVYDGAVTAHFDHVRVQNNAFFGILFQQTNAGVRGSIRNSVVTDNGGAGIQVSVFGPALDVVDIDSTEISSNGWVSVEPGVDVYVSDPNAKAEVSVANSLIARNRGGGVFTYMAAAGEAHVSVTDSTVTGNYGHGLVTTGALGGTLIASRNTITRNEAAGLRNNGGTLYSTQDNRVQGNFGGATSGTITPLPGI
jgi:Right handed beta helix region